MNANTSCKPSSKVVTVNHEHHLGTLAEDVETLVTGLISLKATPSKGEK